LSARGAVGSRLSALFDQPSLLLRPTRNRSATLPMGRLFAATGGVRMVPTSFVRLGLQEIAILRALAAGRPIRVPFFRPFNGCGSKC
jgi:hypothetical protein